MQRSRIPVDLQNVFLASNSGEDVHIPPPRTSHLKKVRNCLRTFKPKRLGKAGSFRRSSASAGTLASSSLLLRNSIAQAPQAWLEDWLASRGYSTQRYSAVTTAYFNRPSPLQIASYNNKSLEVCTITKDERALRKMMSYGLSVNACNAHGETLMHKVCRLGHHQVLRVFLESGAELRICDNQGRTLLHDACWGRRPSFQTVALLIEREPQLLFMEDSRGACPFEYVQKDHYAIWIEFLERMAEKLWRCPPDCLFQPALVNAAPHSHRIRDPCNPLTRYLAKTVATGRMNPDEFMDLLKSLGHRHDAVDQSDGEFYCEDDSSETSSASDSDSEDDDIRLLDELRGYAFRNKQIDSKICSV